MQSLKLGGIKLLAGHTRFTFKGMRMLSIKMQPCPLRQCAAAGIKAAVNEQSTTHGGKWR